MDVIPPLPLPQPLPVGTSRREGGFHTKRQPAQDRSGRRVFQLLFKTLLKFFFMFWRSCAPVRTTCSHSIPRAFPTFSRHSDLQCARTWRACRRVAPDTWNQPETSLSYLPVWCECACLCVYVCVRARPSRHTSRIHTRQMSEDGFVYFGTRSGWKHFWREGF